MSSDRPAEIPHSKGTSVLITAFTMTALSTVVVATRFYCRRFLVRAVRVHDYLILSALLMTWGVSVINFFQVHYGTGTSVWNQRSFDSHDQQLEWYKSTVSWWYAYQIAYLVTLGLIKFSILFFYRTIATRRRFRIAVYVTMGVVGLFIVSMVFVNAFVCLPPNDSWSWNSVFAANGADACKELHTVYVGQAAGSIASDLIILMLPIPMLVGLQMQLRKRVAVIAILSVGIVAVVASVVRLWALDVWSHSFDSSYQGGYVLIFTQVELNAAIICASVPSLKPLFAKLVGGSASARSDLWHFLYTFPDDGGSVDQAMDEILASSGVLSGTRRSRVALKAMPPPRTPSPALTIHSGRGYGLYESRRRRLSLDSDLDFYVMDDFSTAATDRRARDLESGGDMIATAAALDGKGGGREADGESEGEGESDGDKEIRSPSPALRKWNEG